MRASGRWHLAGTPVVYCADHPATALLERLVHIDLEDMPAGYTLMTIDLPAEPAHRIDISDLPDDWKTSIETTQAIGDGVLSAVDHLIVWVPSALVPYAWNALLNPRHPAAATCAIVDTISSLFDPRLIR